MSRHAASTTYQYVRSTLLQRVAPQRTTRATRRFRGATPAGGPEKPSARPRPCESTPVDRPGRARPIAPRAPRAPGRGERIAGHPRSIRGKQVAR